MRTWLTLAVALLWLVLSPLAPGFTRVDAQAVATAVATDEERGAKPWLGRHGEFEEYLKKARIVREEATKVGVTRPRRIYFEPGGLIESAVAKPLPTSRQTGYLESYQSEVAAYLMDRLLGLDMVPPTVERGHAGKPASVQFWVNNAVWLKEAQKEGKPRDPESWNRQTRRWRVFDNLIANIDRNEGNLLVVRNPDWHLVLIDHSRAFTNRKDMVFPMTMIDRSLFERLKALDKPTLDAAIGKLLLDGSGPILRRRDAIVAHFEKLAAERGEAAAFTP